MSGQVRGTILAGAALSLSGRFAVQGEQARRGFVLWAEHVNRQGGLRISPNGSRAPVELRIYDDTSRIAGARATTERLIVEDRVSLLFGPYSSVLAIAAAEVAERHRRVLWNHGGSSDALDERGWRRVVTLLSPASRYFEPVLDLATRQANPAGRSIQSVALLYGATGTFPRAVIGGARAHAARLGLNIVLEAPYPPTPAGVGEAPFPQPPPRCAGEGEISQVHAGPARGSGDGGDGERGRRPRGAGLEGAEAVTICRLVREIARRQPDVVLGVGTTEADLAFAAELRRHQVQAVLVGLVAAPIQRFRDVLGGAADGFCGPSQWEPVMPGQPDFGPSSAEFSVAFKGRFGTEPDYPAAQAYAAGLVAARCAEVAGSLDDGALLRAAGALDLTTFYGRFRLDPRTGQQIGHAMVVAQWQAGQKQIVWPPASATAPPQLPLPAPAPTSRPVDETPSS